MRKLTRRCFTCKTLCFGYQCRECARKGRWGSLTRRTVNRRYNNKRGNNASN